MSDVDTDLVVKALRPIWNAKTETAVRRCGCIEAILDWATVSKYRAGDNPARWRGHLENARPDQAALIVTGREGYDALLPISASCDSQQGNQKEAHGRQHQQRKNHDRGDPATGAHDRASVHPES